MSALTTLDAVPTPDQLRQQADLIAEITALGDAWADRPALIERARQAGVTWQAIADGLRMTPNGVRKLYATRSDSGGA
jgi:hypothetical protein